MKKKFAFLVHLRSYEQDLPKIAPWLKFVPENCYNFIFNRRPFNPFVFTEVSITPNSTEPDGYLILVPYSGKQLLEQGKKMLPLLKKALQLAAQKGAEITGLGALTSPISGGGKLLLNNPFTAITNGNAYTAVITFKRILQLVKNVEVAAPHIAIVGATGSVGNLVTELLNFHLPAGKYTLVARNAKKLSVLAGHVNLINEDAEVTTATEMDAVKNADVVVLLTSSSDCILKSGHLKKNAVVLDVTQPRNAKPELLIERPDVKLIDGGLVYLPYLNFNRKNIGLPKGISFACLAETMLLALAGHTQDFSVGNPTLQQANYVMELADKFSHLGFGLAPDHCFGEPIKISEAKEVSQQLVLY